MKLTGTSPVLGHKKNTVARISVHNEDARLSPHSRCLVFFLAVYSQGQYTSSARFGFFLKKNVALAKSRSKRCIKLLASVCACNYLASPRKQGARVFSWERYNKNISIATLLLMDPPSRLTSAPCFVNHFSSARHLVDRPWVQSKFMALYLYSTFDLLMQNDIIMCGFRAWSLLFLPYFPSKLPP